MDCKSWRSEELLPVAYSLAEILMKDLNISGVAITGSVARLELHVHDIDLIVFHNGNMKDVACTHDSLHTGDRLRVNSVGTKEVVIDHDYHGSAITKSVKQIVVAPIYGELSEACKEVPVHYIFVHEKILSDCSYLQSLLPRGKGLLARMGFRLKEAMKESEERLGDEFYATVFCEIPLLLIDPASSRGAILDYASGVEHVPGADIACFRTAISHQCSDARCKPMGRWAERRWKVKERQGYACVAEQRKRQEAAKGGLSVSADNSGALSYPQTGGEVSLIDE